MAIPTLITANQLHQFRKSLQGQTLAFVPTMGALHEGHLSLIREAKSLSDRVLVSIFVNPTQFAPNEDFATYPRMLKEDISKLETLGVDAVFVPNAANMYPEGFQTYVNNEQLAPVLCGAYRPGHFQGVLTVVCKLLNMVQADVAIFGKKDFQQYLMIRNMVRDLNIPVKIVGGETVREADGLAMSSRNLKLSEQERNQAPQLYAGLNNAREKFAQGVRSVSTLIASFREQIDPGVFRIQYAEIRDAENLQMFANEEIDKPAVFAVAAYLGAVRLIDNVELG